MTDATRKLATIVAPEIRSDPRFVRLCARLGLVEFLALKRPMWQTERSR